MSQIKKENTKKQKIIFWNIAFVLAIAVSAVLLVFNGKTLAVEVETAFESFDVVAGDKDHQGKPLGSECPYFQMAFVNSQNSGELAYCLNHGLHLPGNYNSESVINKGPELPRGVVEILEHGAPYTDYFHTDDSNGFKATELEGYYITQYALWLYRYEKPELFQKLDSKPHTLETWQRRDGACLRGNSSNTRYNQIAAAIKWLADLGKAADGRVNSISLNPTSNKLTISSDKKYYQSGVINLTSTGKLKEFDVSVNGGAQAFNKTANSFQVRIPVGNVTSSNLTLNVQVTGKFQHNKAYLYISKGTTSDGEEPQNMTASVLESDTKTTSTPLNLEIEALVRMGFAKKDATTGAYVAGATLQLRRPNGTTQNITTGTQPVYLDDLIPGNYTLTEIAAPNGYIINTTPVNFAVTAGQDTKVISVSDHYTKYSFIKRDTDGEVVEGAVLKVVDASNNVIERWTTTKTAHKIEKKLIVGQTYRLIEESAPTGYLLQTTPVTFTVSTNTTEQSIVMENQYTTVALYKKDKDNEPVVGATLALFDGDTLIERWTTDASAHTIKKKLKVGKTYQLREEKTPGGYLLNRKALDVKIENTASVQNFTMIDDYTDIEILKRDTDGAAVEGVVLKLVNAKGDTIDTWTTTTESHRIKKRLVVGEKYKIVEVSAPPGYLMMEEPQEFTVKETAKLQTITVNNKYTKILISKIDANTNKPIYGVTFLIKDKAGKERYQFKIEKDICKITELESGKTTEEETQNNACLIRKIPIGIYTLEEVEAPEGYVLNKTPITFEVRNDGNVQRIILKHNYTKLLIMGHSVTVDSLLVGITFQIRDSADQEVAKFKTNGKPYTVSNLPLGKYTIREVEVPDGFVLNKEPVEFEVTGDEHEVMLPNDFIKVQISKRDITNEKEVAGAKLEIRDSKGKLVDKWTSKESEEHLIERLKPGKYTLKETVVPKGYQAETTTIEFTVKETGDIQKVIMHNTPIVDVPDTKAGISIVAYVLGGIIAISGIGMIYINFIYRKKEKKI